MDLTPADHVIFVVTDVVVAIGFVVIVVAQLKEQIPHHGPVFFSNCYYCWC